jgi:hypothetical protein
MRFARLMMSFQTVTTIYNFNQIVERKAWFDKYGEYGLKEGVPGPNGSNKLSFLII